MNKENCALKLVDEIILYGGMFGPDEQLLAFQKGLCFTALIIKSVYFRSKSVM